MALSAALAGFAALELALGLVLEPRPDLRLAPRSDEGKKFAQYRAHAADYDLVYVGTSRVHRGFDPAAFDARLAELGKPRRSFNFGLVGMSYLELRQLVAWILAHRPSKLDVLLVDPSDRAVDADYGNWFTLRDVAWHDAATTRAALGFTLAADEALARKLDLSARHLLSAARRATHVGLGASWLERALDTRTAPVPFPDGFGAWELAGAGQDAPELRATRAAPIPPPSEPPWITMQAIEELARAAGVRVLFAIPPTTRPLAPFREAHERGQMREFLSFPARENLDLFERHDDYFYDQGHLNSKGAALFSRRLADAVAERLR